MKLILSMNFNISDLIFGSSEVCHDKHMSRQMVNKIVFAVIIIKKWMIVL